MPINGYKIRDQAATHFMTFTVVNWVDVFTRKIYRDILLDSIRYCQKEKGLILNAWCVMSNHIHLVASARFGNLSDIVRDLKTFTSKQIVAAISQNEKESRKEWMLRLFAENGIANTRNKFNQFWIQDNRPKICYSNRFTFQKINYIHRNPVVAGIVDHPWEYIYSSARDYHEGRNCGLLPLLRLA